MKVRCRICSRVVNGYVPSTYGGGETYPRRHLPPSELGQEGAVAGGGWMGHGRWCMGAHEPAEIVEANV